MDKISIVVAVYNAEKFLKKCIDSLLNQTYTNTEIILVNDFSTDSSLNICNEYSCRFTNVITVNNEQNFGVSATRNRGIEISAGDYICFVDSDDYVEPDYIEKLYTYYKKYNTVPVCGFVYHDEYNHCKPVNYTWSRGDELVSLGEAFKLNNEMYLTALWNKLFDNRLIKEYNVRFDEKISMGEDLRFSVDYFQKANTEYIYAFCDALYHYTKLTSTTLMASFARKGTREGIESLEIIKKLAIKFNKSAEKEYSIAVEDYKNNLIYFLIRDKGYSKRTKLIKIREINPAFSEIDYLKRRFVYFKEIIAKLVRK